jgi:hypothetical protein
VLGTVTASVSVASVEIRIASYSIVATKTAPGLFRVSYVVPNLPFFLRKTYDVKVIARNTRGDQTSREVPLTIR